MTIQVGLKMMISKQRIQEQCAFNAYDNSSKLDFNGGNNIIDWADKKYYDVMKRIDLVTAASRIKLKQNFF